MNNNAFPEVILTTPSIATARLNASRIADVSTEHITREDGRLLREGGRPDASLQENWPVIATIGGGEGHVILVEDHGTEGEENFPGASAAFHQICLLAAEQGCSYVRFDRDGTTYSTLPRFDW